MVRCKYNRRGPFPVPGETAWNKSWSRTVCIPNCRMTLKIDGRLSSSAYAYDAPVEETRTLNNQSRCFETSRNGLSDTETAFCVPVMKFLKEQMRNRRLRSHRTSEIYYHEPMDKLWSLYGSQRFYSSKCPWSSDPKPNHYTNPKPKPAALLPSWTWRYEFMSSVSEGKMLVISRAITSHRTLWVIIT